MSLLWTPAMALLSDRAEAAGVDLAFGAALVNLAWAGGQVLGGSAGASLAQATSDALAYGAVAALFLLTALAIRKRRAASTLEVSDQLPEQPVELGAVALGERGD
jgi:hypothetical protein